MLCVECKATLSLTPVVETILTIGGAMNLSSSSKLCLKETDLPSVESLKLEQPIPQFYPRGIKWDFFPSGRNISGTLGVDILEGNLTIGVIANVGKRTFTSATLTIFPEFSACETRPVVLNADGSAPLEDGGSDDAGGTDDSLTFLRVQEPFRGHIFAGARCCFFGIPSGLIPEPTLCDAGHSIPAKREELARAREAAAETARRIPRAVRAAQANTILCDPFGPPRKALAGPAVAPPHTCVDYLDAMVAFAQSGHGSVTEHPMRWDEALQARMGRGIGGW
jgi:hypothetical protein